MYPYSYFYSITKLLKNCINYLLNTPMKNILLLAFAFLTIQTFAQGKNYKDQPMVETAAQVDTLVTPDKIFLKIVLNEKDSRNRISIEQLETTMYKVLNSLKIDLEKNLTITDYSSNFKNYFLKKQNILKRVSYILTVKDALTVGKVMAGLEQEDISEVSIFKTEYSKSKQLFLDLKSKAVQKAKQQAKKMVAPLNQNIGKAIFISDVENKLENSQLVQYFNEIELIGTSTITALQAVPKEDFPDIKFRKIEFTSKVKVIFTIE